MSHALVLGAEKASGLSVLVVTGILVWLKGGTQWWRSATLKTVTSFSPEWRRA